MQKIITEKNIVNSFSDLFKVEFKTKYSKELYDNSVAINAIFTGNGNLFNRITDRITWGIYGYQGIIMSDVYAMLQTELRNPNNSPKDIEHIEEVLEYYRKQRREIKKKYK